MMMASVTGTMKRRMRLRGRTGRARLFDIFDRIRWDGDKDRRVSNIY
jgi:hypothetical protein